MSWRRLWATGQNPVEWSRKTRFLVDEDVDPEVAGYLREKGYNCHLRGSRWA